MIDIAGRRKAGPGRRGTRLRSTDACARNSRLRSLYLGLVLAGAGLPPARAEEHPALPSLQDMEIAGRILAFDDAKLSGPVDLAVLFDPAKPESREEASAIAALLAGGVIVGDLVLRPVLVPQAQLADRGGFGAVFATANVNQRFLSEYLAHHQLPCLTRHLEQVERGACTVAIASAPRISIVVNQANAASASIRFATAFRMMVREI